MNFVFVTPIRKIFCVFLGKEKCHFSQGHWWYKLWWDRGRRRGGSREGRRRIWMRVVHLMQRIFKPTYYWIFWFPGIFPQNLWKKSNCQYQSESSFHLFHCLLLCKLCTCIAATRTECYEFKTVLRYRK